MTYSILLLAIVIAQWAIIAYRRKREQKFRSHIGQFVRALQVEVNEAQESPYRDVLAPVLARLVYNLVDEA